MATKKARVALLTNKIPGLVKFGTRVGRILEEMEIDLVHLGSSRFDVLSEDVPDREILYFSDFSKGNSVYSKEIDIYIYDNISTNILWSDIDRSQSLNIRLSNFYKDDRLIHKLISFFIDSIDSNGVSLFLYELPSNVFSLAAWHASRIRRIPYLGLMPARLPGRFQIISRPFDQAYDARILWQEDITSALGFEIADKYLSQIDGQELEYMRLSPSNPQGSLQKYGKIDKFKLLWHEMKIANGIAASEDSMSVPDPMHYRWAYVVRTIQRNRRIGKLKSFFHNSIPKGDYILYPMHLHPEASTSVYGAKYCDEFNVITRIASNIPIGMKLVVKDHIHAVGTQPMSFYERLSKMPNVVLLNPSFNIKIAIRHAKAMVTNTSTAGFEALALGCPVFLLGEAPYNFVPWCIKIDSVEEIFNLIKNIPDKPSNEDCRKFVSIYADTTHPGIFNFDKTKSSAEIEQYIARFIESYLNDSNYADC